MGDFSKRKSNKAIEQETSNGSTENSFLLDEAAQATPHKSANAEANYCTNPFLAFHEACREIGGIDLELPKRQPPQESNAWWLTEKTSE